MGALSVLEALDMSDDETDINPNVRSASQAVSSVQPEVGGSEY